MFDSMMTTSRVLSASCLKLGFVKRCCRGVGGEQEEEGVVMKLISHDELSLAMTI